MATRTLAEAENALRSQGLSGQTLDMALSSLRNAYGSQNLGVVSAPSAAGVSNQQQAPVQAAGMQQSDPYTIFNQQLLQMLTRQQAMGTKRFAEQGFNAQQAQNDRVSAPVTPDLVGANPNLQNSVRSASAGALNPTIQQAGNAQQTFGEQINSYGNALQSAQGLLQAEQARADKERDDARNILNQALQSFGAQAFDIVDPKMITLAGYNKDTIALAKQTIKQQEDQARAQAAALRAAGGGGGGGGGGTTPTGTLTGQQTGLLNDISNVLSDPSFDNAFGITNIVNRNTPSTGAFVVKSNVDQIIGQLALAARGQLKGQGQVSDFEGKLLRNAQTALKFNMSPDQARFELKQVAGAIRTSSGLTAAVRITAPDGTSQTGMANQATIMQAVADGNRVEYL